jgi:hypothetical protein
MMQKQGIYIASRASFPQHPANWRKLRDVDGWNVTCSWIDEAGAGETADFSELWSRIEAEIKDSERLILYVEPEDFPLKGALIEAGMALALGIKVFIVAKDLVLEKPNFRPIGSWINHPLVQMVDSMETALIGAYRKQI